jgi:broad specificity phosphatase PhoE
MAPDPTAPHSPALYLVRHARAGDPRSWRLPDDQRPLTAGGTAQAAWVADTLAARGVDVIRSSPSVRCVDTVRPLAERVGLAVTADPTLAEDADDDEVLATLAGVTGRTAVLCTHGNIVPVVLDHLRRTGTAFGRPPHHWKKGSIWELRTDGGRVVEASYLPPPV